MKQPFSCAACLAVFCTGAVSIGFQIIISREVIALFHGNELTAGTTLAIWLMSTAAGSALFPRIYRKTPDRSTLCLLLVLLTAVLMASFAMLRFARQILSITPGEIAGIALIFPVTLLITAPACLISGSCFAAASTCLRAYTASASQPSDNVYFWESAGSALGGAMCSFLLIRYADPLTAVMILCAVSGISALFIYGKQRRIITAAALACTACVLALGLAARPAIEQAPWPGQELIYSRNSVHGRLCVTSLGTQHNFYQNGVLLFSVPDQLYAEETVHYAMLAHTSPERVLLIGGSPGSMIREINKHPGVLAITYVDLDPALVKKALEDSGLRYPAVSDSISGQVRVETGDGRKMLVNDTTSYDVIINALPNPYNAQLNRFYTMEFFKAAKKRLLPGGVISVRAPCAENTISKEQSEYLNMLHATMKSVFPKVVCLPGSPCTCIGYSDADAGIPDTAALIQKIKERNIAATYVNQYILPYTLSEERVNYVASHIHSQSVDINRDFKPAAYFYDAILWASASSPGFSPILKTARTVPVSTLLAVIVILHCLYVLISFKRNHKIHRAISVQYSIFITGFTEISLELSAIISFQILYGYAYFALSVIIAAYMTGLAAGSFVSQSRTHRETYGTILLYVQAAIGVLPLLFLAMLAVLRTWPLPDTALLGIFGLSIASCGFIGGFQFPVAASLIRRKPESPGTSSSILYSRDLAGSAAGALLVSTLLVPVYGVYNTLILLTLLNCCAAAFLLLSGIASKHVRHSI